MKHKIIDCFRYPEVYRLFFTSYFENKIIYMFNITSVVNEETDALVCFYENPEIKICCLQNKEEYLCYYLDDI